MKIKRSTQIDRYNILMDWNTQYSLGIIFSKLMCILNTLPINLTKDFFKKEIVEIVNLSRIYYKTRVIKKVALA